MREVSLEGLREYLSREGGKRTVKEVVLHHTYRPRAAQYQGQATWAAIRRYHTEQRHWSDIGYHFGVGPDGSVWLLRPVSVAGAHVLGRNAHTVGVAMVGDFDQEAPATHGVATAAAVCAEALDRYGLGTAAVRFHREFAAKTCPGRLVDLGEFRRLVAGAMSRARKVKGRRVVKMVDAGSGLVVGQFTLAAGGDHIADQGKVYVETKAG